MRATTLLRRLVDVTATRVTGVQFFGGGELSVEVAPLWRRPRCGVCGRRAPVYDRRPLRWWRHLVIGARVVRLAYAPWRVRCPQCGVRTERVPWGASASRFTWDFEEWVAYLAQITDQTQVHKLTGVAWATVGQIIERVVSRRLSPQRLANLRRIGIDEFSYRKRHRYLTIVVDHDRRRVVWAAEGRSAETLSAFFRELGPEACAAIELVSIDMTGGYKKAIAEFLPAAQVIYDRFHVQRLASDAEGLNNKLRTISRRAYGFHSAEALIAMLFLNSGGIELSPRLPATHTMLRRGLLRAHCRVSWVTLTRQLRGADARSRRR
jgi:transposase